MVSPTTNFCRRWKYVWVYGISQDEALQAMERCLSNIQQWFILHRLMINDDKTEFLSIWYPTTIKQNNCRWWCYLTVGDININPVSSVRNLGLWLDNMQVVYVKHITKASVMLLYFISITLGELRSTCLKTAYLHLFMHSLPTALTIATVRCMVFLRYRSLNCSGSKTRQQDL